MRRILVLFFLGLFGYGSICSALSQTCGTTVSDKVIKEEEAFQDYMRRARINGDAINSLAITPHVVRRSNGTGGLTEEEIFEAIEDLNEAYVGTQLRFYIDDEINFINSDTYFDFDASQEGNFAPSYNVTNTINIYFFNTLSSGSSALCGYTYLPEDNVGKNLIMMANGCTVGGSTLAHEVGHFFNLFHTHGVTNTGTTDELVDGSNCSTNGDRVCDTPADPNLSGAVDASVCAYAGSATDSNGARYKPDARNFMSYSISSCRKLFTQGQKDRMLAAFNNYKTDIKSEEINVDFRLVTNVTCSGDILEFENLSRGVESIEWTFEGGIPSTSTLENPMVEFPNAGNYTITLVGTDDQDNDYTYEREINVYDIESVDNQASLPYKQSFEDNTSLPTIINVDEDVTFMRVPDNSNDGAFSYVIEQYYNRNIGSQDYLLLPSFLNDNGYYQFRFAYAYKQSINGYDDKLEVIYREDCGDWNVLWEKEGSDLSTNNDFTIAEFLPSSQDWVNQTIEFPIDESSEVFEIAIRASSDVGNSIYIDDLQLTENDPAFSITSIDISRSSCPGVQDGSIVVNTDGGLEDLEFSLDGVEFQTENLFDGLSNGDLVVYVRNPNSNIVESESIKIIPQSTYPTTPSLFINGKGELVANASLLPGQFFEWFYEDELIEGEDGSSIQNPLKGAYQVGVSNGICASYSEPFLVLSAIDEQSSLTIFPNPFSDNINFSRELNRRNLSVFNSLGQLVFRGTIEKSLDFSYLKPGIYLFQVNGKSIKMVKTK